MELYHMVTKPASQKCFPKDKPCPLALANNFAHPRVSSPSRIAFDLPSKQLDEPTREALSRVANHPAMSDLRELQASLDTIGPLNATPNNADFTLAMTLRDCTCFVQVGDGQPNARSPLPIKIRLSDFDWKDPNVKAERWRRAEQELIQGGYYTADWIFAGGQLYHPPTLCQLEWKHRRRTDDVEVICLVDKSSPRCQEPAHDPEALLLPAHTKTYHHSTDLKFLHKRLQPFKKEPPGTPLESMLNPYRSQFSI
jgi:inositol-pentakisphosphate 2-kinase